MSRLPMKSPACERLEHRRMLAADEMQPPGPGRTVEAAGGWRLEVDFTDLIGGRVVRVESPGVLRLAPQPGATPPSDLRLALHDDSGRLLVATADPAGRDPDALRQFVSPGSYVLVAQAAQPGKGGFRIDFTPGESPVLPLAVGSLPASVASADIDGDRILDLLVANYGSAEKDDPNKGDLAVCFGLGDGSFRWGDSIRVGDNPVSVAVGAAGRTSAGLLAVTANRGGDSVSVVRISKSEGFAAPLMIDVGRAPNGVALADIDRDGLTDIIVANSETDELGPLPDGVGSCSVLLQTAAGEFVEAWRLPAGGHPEAVAVDDLDEDGLPDIVAANPYSNAVVIFRQTAGRTFDLSASPISVGTKPNALTIGDIDGDRRKDIVVANSMSDDVTVVRQQLDGTFPSSAGPAIKVGTSPYSIVVADVDGDGWSDILTANQGSNDVSVLRGAGAGAFLSAESYATGSYPSSLAVARFDADNALDLVTADLNDGTVSLLHGFGDGGFFERRRLSAGSFPYAVAVGDVNGDGRPDVVTANRESSDLSVLLGRGDGSFAKRRTLAVDEFALRPVDVLLADINGDGRLDIVTANEGLGTGTIYPEPVVPGGVCILFGLGDGTFTPPQVELMTAHPGAVAVADLNGDELPDIVATVGRPAEWQEAPAPDLWKVGDISSGAVYVLLQQFDGTYSSQQAATAVGRLPSDVAVTDLDGDGAPDVVFCTTGFAEFDDRGSVAVMYGDGRGGFSVPLGLAAGNHPQSLAVADVDGDERPDIVVVNANRLDRKEAGDVSVLLQKDRRRFVPQAVRLPVGLLPYGVAIEDFTGDRRPDIIVSNVSSKSISMLAGDGTGSFAAAVPVSFLTAAPGGLATGDIDRDGRPDLVTANLVTNDVAVVMQSGWTTLGDGPNPRQGGVSHAVGLLAPTAGRPQGTVTVDRGGDVIVRRGGLGGILAASAGKVFDLCALASRDGSVRFAAIDADRQTLSIHREAADGSLLVLERLSAAPAGDVDGPQSLLLRVVSTDLNGDGWGDLVASNPGAGTIDVLVAAADGGFDASAWQRLEAGAGPARIVIADMSGDDVPDIVTANQASGDVSIRLGVDGVHGTAAFTAATGFTAEQRYRTSGIPYGYGLDPVSGRGNPLAPFTLSDVAVGDVNGDGLRDIVAVNSQARSFAVLAGAGGGRFAAPQEYLVRVPDVPGPVVAGRSIEVQDVAIGLFDADNKADIALLDRAGERLLVYPGHSLGQTTGPAVVVPLTGNLPRSIAAVDAPGYDGRTDGVLDILVGNDYGDVLLLAGVAGAPRRGTGQFAPAVRADTSVALVATDVDGDGRDDFVYGDRGLDRIRLDRKATPQSFSADQAQGVIGPSAVAFVTETVAGRQVKHLVVANGGGNEILLFRRDLAASALDADIFLPPQRFFVGTNPAALKVADVDQDGLADVVVANAGSNDLSILRGAIDGAGRWTMTFGLRVESGGDAPAGVAVGDFVTAAGERGSDGIPDLVVTNRGSGTANVIAGRNGGFFNDRLPISLELPSNAAPGPIFASGSTIAIGNVGAASVTLFDVTRGGANAELFFSRSYASGGSGPSSLAVFQAAGTTYLAVGNTSGIVSLFLGRPGSIDFTRDRSFELANVTGIAFDSVGRLFAMSPNRQSALQLFAFENRPAESSAAAGLAALRAAVVFVPLRASQVALVAMIVSVGGSGALPRAEGAEAELQEEDAEVVEHATAGAREITDAGLAKEPTEAAEDGEAVAEPAVPGLKLFLDVDNVLQENNTRLIDSLLDERNGAEGGARPRDQSASDVRPQGGVASLGDSAAVALGAAPDLDAEVGRRSRPDPEDGPAAEAPAAELSAPVGFVQFPVLVALAVAGSRGRDCGGPAWRACFRRWWGGRRGPKPGHRGILSRLPCQPRR
jgi:hypothetical protein